MATKPITDLTQHLPVDWTKGQIVSPRGSDVGYGEEYGYIYLMQTVNALIQAVNTINGAFDGLLDSTSKLNLTNGVTGILPEANGGTGAQTLTASGVDYVPGSLPITADNVQDALTFLAGSYFPKLAVTVPAGSLVTVQMDSYSYQQTAAEGTASFVLPALGQWTVQASLNEQTATRTVDVDNLGQTFQLTVSYFTATLNVTAPTGATVTATSGLN